jgi:hypothetical protein
VFGKIVPPKKTSINKIPPPKHSHLANQDYLNPHYLDVSTHIYAYPGLSILATPLLMKQFPGHRPCRPRPQNTEGSIDDRRIAVGSIDDRRVAVGSIDDRRVAVTPRRASPRYRTFKGAQVFWPWPVGAYDKCIIRNLSETGACLEIHVPVLHKIFVLVFDEDKSRRTCCVMWRKEPRIGVRFQ